MDEMSPIYEDERPENSPDFCWSHYVIEPVPEDCYRVCGECMHTFATEADLARDNWLEWGDCRPVELVYSCPHCIHNF